MHAIREACHTTSVRNKAEGAARSSSRPTGTAIWWIWEQRSEVYPVIAGIKR